MAIYHLNSGFVSRSTGRSCVQAAAYLTGEKLYETRRDLVADYTNRGGDVVFKMTLAPDDAPSWMSTTEVWDKLETFEDTYANNYFKSPETKEKHITTAQIGMTLVMALPKEISLGSSKELIEQFLKERFVSRGLIGTAVIHDKEDGNPHAHLLVSRRAYNPETGSFALKKDREIVTRYEFLQTRKLWADIVNDFLEREGIDQRIDHRSFEDQGLDLIPSRHEGWYASNMDKLRSRIVTENREIAEVNREKILINPELILDELSLRQATFTKTDLSRLIQKRMKDDTELGSSVYEVCCKEIIEVGIGVNGETRYTTNIYKGQEETALKQANTLLSKESSPVIDLQRLHERLSTSYGFFNNEKRQVIEILCRGSQLSVLVGRAGAGKTTALKPVVEAYKEAGYKVMGMSLAAKAAENLELETGCVSESLAFYLDKWERLQEARKQYWSLHPTSKHRLIEVTIERLKKYELTKRHVVILDEAGMVGTKDWAKILDKVCESGAKLIAVGDDHQFKAIEAGDFFRKLKDRAKESGSFASLDTIMRQREPWMKNASHKLAEHNTYEALADYEQHGFIKGFKRQEAFEKLVEEYIAHKNSHPKESSLLLAYTREDCALLNEVTREKLKEEGWIRAQGHIIRGKEYCLGDQITFLKNDRDKKIEAYDPRTGMPQAFLIKNGTEGKIIGLEAIGEKDFSITVALDEKTHVRFKASDYKDFSYGYALTLLKSQGQTVDRSFILASRYMDAHNTYVALTRHRKETRFYYGKEDFSDFRALQQSLGRVQDKDLVIDYHKDPRSPEQIRVHEYVILGQDLNTLAHEKEWEAYRSLHTTRKALGREILDKWETHQEDVRQAGLTRESLEITCGLKARPLSRAETQAYKLALSYQEKADEARALWREIRSTHPGSRCYAHEKYEEFSILRQERDKTAYELISNPGLLSLAYKASQDDLRVSRKTLEIQSAHYMGWKNLSEQNKPHVYGQAYHSYTQETVKAQFEYIHTLTPDEVKRSLQEHTADLARDLLGNPSSQSLTQWRYGSKGSIAVFVAGTKQGLYSNFESGVSGGCLKMIEEQLGIDYKEAYKWALDWLGHKEKVILERPIKVKETTQEIQKAWTPVMPVPINAREPNLYEKPLSYQLEGRHESVRFAYTDREGTLLGYVVRLEDDKGDKVTLPLTYCRNTQSKEEWRWHGFGENRPLYGLDHLAEHPEKPVLIVEGEKAAEAGRKMLPDHVVITWQGGASAVKKADWSPLQGRDVTIWPDHDEPGLKAAHKIEEVFEFLPEKPKDISIVNLPAELPKKWDLADPLPEGWTDETVKGLIRKDTEKLTITRQDAYQQGPDRITLISKTIHTYGLDRAFDEPHSNLHSDVDKLYQKSKNAYSALNIPLDSERLIERCTFMAMQIQKLSITESAVKENSDIWRLMSVSSILWMSERDEFNTEINSDRLARAEERIQDHNEVRETSHTLSTIHSVYELTGIIDLTALKWNNVPSYQKALQDLKQTTQELFDQQRDYQSQTKLLIDKTIEDYNLVRFFGAPPHNIYENVNKLYKGFEEANKTLDIPVNAQELTERCAFMAMQLQNLTDEKLPPITNDQDILRRLSISSILWMEGRDEENPGFTRTVLFEAVKKAQEHDEINLKYPPEINPVVEITAVKNTEQINWENIPAFEQAKQKLEQTANELFKETLIDKTIDTYRLDRIFGKPQQTVHANVDKLYKGFEDVYKALDIPVDRSSLIERCTFSIMQIQKTAETESGIDDKGILRKISLSSTWWIQARDRENVGFEHELLSQATETIKKHDDIRDQDAQLRDLIPIREITGIRDFSNAKHRDLHEYEQAHQKLDEIAKDLFKQQRDYQNQPEAIIDRTIKQHRLDSAFGEPQSNIHKNVRTLYKGFEELYSTLGLQVQSQELIERCAFMTMQLQKLAQPHFSEHLGDQDLARRMSVSSFLWMEGRDHGSLTFERDILYKSARIVNEHSKTQEQDPSVKERDSIRELTGVRDFSRIDTKNRDSFEKAHQQLEKIAQKLLEQQKLEQQRIMRQQERQRLMERSRGLER